MKVYNVIVLKKSLGDRLGTHGGHYDHTCSVFTCKIRAMKFAQKEMEEYCAYNCAMLKDFDMNDSVEFVTDGYAFLDHGICTIKVQESTLNLMDNIIQCIEVYE